VEKDTNILLIVPLFQVHL